MAGAELIGKEEIKEVMDVLRTGVFARYAALAVENAYHVAQLERKVAERTAELQHAEARWQFALESTAQGSQRPWSTPVRQASTRASMLEPRPEMRTARRAVTSATPGTRCRAAGSCPRNGSGWRRRRPALAPPRGRGRGPRR